MKVILAAFVLLILADGSHSLGAQFSGHKSTTDIARMTPQQRVEEYCREYVRHGGSDDDYQHLLQRSLNQDWPKVVPHLVKIIDQYDPKIAEKGDRFDAAWILLSDMDETVVRLRASEEGRIAIDAIRQAVGRMKATHYDSTEAWQYKRQGRYQLSLAALKTMDGINRCDEAIRATLMLKYKIMLSDQQLLDFVNYLIPKDPHYPAWSQSEEYKDLNGRNQAGNPIWYLVMTKPEPFYDAYVGYKSKSAR